MITRKSRFITIVMVIASVLVGCDQGQGSVQSTPIQPSPTVALKVGSSLQQALAFTPANVNYVAFTDWTLIKKYMGLETLPAKRSEDQLRELLDKSESQMPAAWVDRDRIYLEPTLLDLWSWDFTDLLWETELRFEGEGYASKFKFRDDFDLAPVIARYKERGFKEEQYGGATIYSRDITMTEEWEQSGASLAMYNTAILADKKVLILSVRNESVRAVLDAAQKGGGATLAGDTGVMEMLGEIGELGSAVIMPGASGCTHFFGDPESDRKNLSPELYELVDAARKKLTKSSSYDAYAAGYRYEGRQSLGFVAMHYSTVEAAKSDVEIRRSLLSQGVSIWLNSGVSYDELIAGRKGSYQVEASGKTLLVKMRGEYFKIDIDGQEQERNWIPNLPYRMWAQSDMTFALCP